MCLFTVLYDYGYVLQLNLGTDFINLDFNLLVIEAK